MPIRIPLRSGALDAIGAENGSWRGPWPRCVCGPWACRFQDKLITSTDVTNGKPHPEPYQKAAGILGFSPSDCIVIEDAPAGVLAGKAAGARVIAFPTTMAIHDLESAGADWIVENCAAITAHNGDSGLVLTLAL